MIEKFELICADILDETSIQKVPEQVDIVVASYSISTFINDA